MTTQAQVRLSARRRGMLRRLLEVRGVVGRHRARHVHVHVLTDDRTRLTATYLPGPAAPTAAAAPAAAAATAAVVLVHGFAAHRRKPVYARLADELARDLSVLALDLRGHGGSAGRSTLGLAEAQDVAAAVRWLRTRGHGYVSLLGVSMGATAVLHAAASGADVDAVVVVSAPARFDEQPETLPLRRLQAVWSTPWKRLALRALLGVRLVPPAGWQTPLHPVEMAAQVQAPLLVVHGEDDAYFPIGEAKALVASAAGPATLWCEPPGFGHAEDGLDADTAAALRVAIGAVAAGHGFPDRHEVRP